MVEIRVAKIPRREVGWEDILATFCLFYPQYTFSDARRLPERRVSQMLKVARNEQYRQYIELANIAAAPHTKNMRGVNKVIDRYKSMIK